MPELSLKFNSSAIQFSYFAGFYYIGYVLFHLPFGLALGRLNSKLVLLCAILLTAVGLIPINYGTSWWLVLAGRLLTGAGSSAASVGAIQIFSLLFRKHFTLALGICVFCGLLTVSGLNGPMSNILILHGMEIGLNLLILVGLLLAGLTLLFFPRLPVAGRTLGIWGDIKVVFGNKKLLFTGVIAGLMIAPVEGFADAWGSAIMQVLHKLDRTSANSLISAIFSGTCIGNLILPYVSEKLRSYYGITLVAALIMVLGFAYLYMGLGDIRILTSICFAIGICCGYQVVMLAKVVTFVPERLSGLAGSVGNMVLMSFGPIFHQIIGLCMERSWDGFIEEGVRIYPRQAYLRAIMPIPAAMLIAIAGLCCLILSEKARRADGKTLGNR